MQHTKKQLLEIRRRRLRRARMAAISLLLIIAAINVQAKNGYLIFIQSENNKPRIHKVNTPTAADTIINRYTYNCFEKFSTAAALQNATFLELRTSTIHIYIEKKQIIVKNGNIKFKRIKK